MNDIIEFKFKAGDTLICVDVCNGLTKGKTYTCVKPLKKQSYEAVRIINDDQVCTCYLDSRFKKAEEKTVPVTKELKYAVPGDVFLCIGWDGCLFTKGDRYEVEKNTEGKIKFKDRETEIHSVGKWKYLDPLFYKLTRPSEDNPFNVGDRVTCINTKAVPSYLDYIPAISEELIEGKVYTVDRAFLYQVCLKVGSSDKLISADWDRFEFANEELIMKRDPKIDPKVGDVWYQNKEFTENSSPIFEVGDKVKYVKDCKTVLLALGDVAEIQEIDKNNHHIKVKVKTGQLCWYASKYFEKVTMEEEIENEEEEFTRIPEMSTSDAKHAALEIKDREEKKMLKRKACKFKIGDEVVVREELGVDGIFNKGETYVITHTDGEFVRIRGDWAWFNVKRFQLKESTMNSDNQKNWATVVDSVVRYGGWIAVVTILSAGFFGTIAYGIYSFTQVIN